MARRLQPTEQPQPARLSIEQMRSAIPLLEKRIAELSGVNLESLTEANGDDTLEAQRTKINATLRGVFGHNTLEYNEYHVDSLSAYTMVIFEHSDTSFRARLTDIRAAVSSALSNLGAAVAILKEQVGDEGVTPIDRTLRAYDGLDLHAEVARAASKLYRDKHYSNAVEAAVKALNGLVRLRSGLDVDGITLMERAFSPNNPILKFNALSDQSDRDEQKGFMQMFSGAVSGLRNPRAHGFINDDPERALEFIAFVSLLAKLLDNAQL